MANKYVSNGGIVLETGTNKYTSYGRVTTETSTEEQPSSGVIPIIRVLMNLLNG